MGRSSGASDPLRVLPESVGNVSEKGAEPLKISSLPGSAMSFAAAELFSKHDGMLLVITEDTASAERMLAETADILGSGDGLLCFPGYETLPYDSFAPRQDVISERAEALYFLRTGKKGVVFVAARSGGAPPLPLRLRLSCRGDRHGARGVLHARLHP